MKKDIKNTWMKGLLMAAVIATAVPLSGSNAWADLATSSTTSQTSVFGPILAILSFACYVIGAVLVVAGLMKFKHHAENPTNTPLSHGFARFGVGAGLVALPFLIGLANSTATNTMGSQSTFRAFGF